MCFLFLHHYVLMCNLTKSEICNVSGHDLELGEVTNDQIQPTKLDIKVVDSKSNSSKREHNEASLECVTGSLPEQETNQM